MSHRHCVGLRWQRSHLGRFFILIGLLLLVSFIPVRSVAAQFLPLRSRIPFLAQTPVLDPNHFPLAKPHPLPLTLASWNDAANQGDYFDQVKPIEVGYLVWSDLPISVFIEPASTATNAFAARQQQEWVKAVTGAVNEWKIYLPLVLTQSAEQADIAVWRSSPPLRTSGATSTQVPRARSAETRYELYWKAGVSGSPPRLSHRCTVLLRPSQTAQYLRAAARHELGHALGIWGHSPLPTDALYFSQVRQPLPISPRDVNTLKRVYEQPTRLGWSVPSRSPE